MHETVYTENDILTTIDNVCYPNPYKFFPQIGSPLDYPLSSKIHLYGDQKRWAIVFEVANYNTNSYTIVIDKYYFGNCVNYKSLSAHTPSENNHDFVEVLSESDIVNITDDLVYYVKDNVNSLLIKGKKINIEHNLNTYKTKNIRGFDFKIPQLKVDIVSCFRLIQENNPGLFNAAETDIRKQIPKDIPKLLTITDWYQEDYQCFGNKFVGRKPSSYETFQLIAKVLVTKNAEMYRPTLKANNHWVNWPKAGTY